MGEGTTFAYRERNKCNDMKIGISDIIRGVRLAIDEVLPNESEFASDKDNGVMDALIVSKIEEAIDFVHGNAELRLMRMDCMKEVTDLSFDNHNVAIKSIAVEIPLDEWEMGSFLRLVKADCESWAYPVTEVLTPDDERYAIVKNKYVGANYQNPAVLYTYRRKRTGTKIVDENGDIQQRRAEGFGGSILELRCLQNKTDEFTVDFLVRAQKDTEGEEDSYDIDGNMVQAVYYYVAGLVMTTYNKSESDNLFNQSLVQMGIAGENGK
jgi:hypothetical protein